MNTKYLIDNIIKIKHKRATGNERRQLVKCEQNLHYYIILSQ